MFLHRQLIGWGPEPEKPPQRNMLLLHPQNACRKVLQKIIHSHPRIGEGMGYVGLELALYSICYPAFHLILLRCTHSVYAQESESWS